MSVLPTYDIPQASDTDSETRECRTRHAREKRRDDTSRRRSSVHPRSVLVPFSILDPRLLHTPRSKVQVPRPAASDQRPQTTDHRPATTQSAAARRGPRATRPTSAIQGRRVHSVTGYSKSASMTSASHPRPQSRSLATLHIAHRKVHLALDLHLQLAS